ncbi:MAG: SemiSWEET transporter [Candidatus Omnitrophica bacterium]|nr:SemiSWEET transporter [Candidatus Omnitrophota bacterium]
MFWPLIGLTAATLTTFSFIPQIIKVVKTRSGRDLSPVTLLQLSLGVALWVFYGWYLRDLIIIVANSLTLASLIVLLCLYVRYKKAGA